MLLGDTMQSSQSTCAEGGVWIKKQYEITLRLSESQV
ncbi:hypothetical protein SAMN06295974_2816 [Plantibacter flavus]|nr:hypothetical protein SAMN06295974_2816 [Plantibacter flavus]